MVPENFEPLTAREALLEIRRQINGYETMAEIDEIAQAGLDRTDPANFELTDHLADRLAEAHKVLRGIVEGHDQARPGRSFLTDEFADVLRGVLALPPDLEAMVERRIG